MIDFSKNGSNTRKAGMTVMSAVMIWCASSVVAVAASDTDVHFTKVFDVLIEKDTITITADAVATVRTISVDRSLNHQGESLMGLPTNINEVHSRNGVFTIHRARPGIADLAWDESVKAAQELKRGKPVGSIGYYRPQITIRENRIVEIEGRGYLRRRRDEPQYLVLQRIRWQPMRWKVTFLDGSQQFYRFNESKTEVTAKGTNWSAKGRVRIIGKQATITFTDKLVEKWTLVDKKVLVERQPPEDPKSDIAANNGIGVRID